MPAFLLPFPFPLLPFLDILGKEGYKLCAIGKVAVGITQQGIV